jgi:hypothetical protein
MNIQDLILGGGLGALIALLLALPAISSELMRRFSGERHKSGDHIVLPDVDTFFGRRLGDRETFALGLLIHLVAGIAYGVIFPLTVQLGLWVFIEPYSVLSHFVFALGAWFVLVIGVFPAMGFGFLGYKDDVWMWLEVLVTTAIMAVIFGAAVNWFQPSWFLI